MFGPRSARDDVPTGLVSASAALEKAVDATRAARMPARMNREKTLRTLGSSFLITLKQPAISLQNLGCHTDWRLRVFDRFDQAPSAIEFFRGAQGGIAEREALDADVDEVLEDLGGLLRGGRLEHDSPLRGHPFHHGLGLSFVLHQYDRRAHGPRDGSWISALLFAVAVEDLALALDVGQRPEPVRHVRVARDEAQRAFLAAAADHDSRSTRLNRAGVVERAVDPVMRATEGRPLLREHQLDDVQCLVQPVHALPDRRKRRAVPDMLRFVPRGADTTDHAPV